MKYLNIILVIIAIFLFNKLTFTLTHSNQKLMDKFIAGESIDNLLTYCENAQPPIMFSFREIIRFANLNPPINLLECIVKKASDFPEFTGIIKYEKGNFWISENVRCYFREENNAIRLVITNLDEHGKRIGGEVAQQESMPEYEYNQEANDEQYKKNNEEIKRIIQPVAQDTERQPPPAEFIVSYPNYTYYPANPYLIYPCLPKFCGHHHKSQPKDEGEQQNINRTHFPPINRQAHEKPKPEVIKNPANPSKLKTLSR